MTDIRAAAERYATDAEEAEKLAASTAERLAWRRRRGHKVCSSCREAKTVSEFGSNAARHDGLDYYCRPCRRKRVKGL